MAYGVHVFVYGFVLDLFAECGRAIQKGTRSMREGFRSVSNPSVRHLCSPLPVRVAEKLFEIPLVGHPRMRGVRNKALAVFRSV